MEIIIVLLHLLWENYYCTALELQHEIVKERDGRGTY